MRRWWTPESVLVYLGSLIVALFVHFTTLRTTDRQAVDAALLVVRAQAAKDAQQYREDKASQNEWRATLNDRDRDYMRKTEVRAVIFTLAAAVAIAGAVFGFATR